MQMSAQQLFRELEQKQFRPFYLVVGEEPFQASEIITQIKRAILKPDEAEFSYDSFDGQGCDTERLAISLQTLPGLFDGGNHRLVSCFRVDQLAPSALESLDSYFHNPVSETSFLMTAYKVDKRKSWVKAVETKGAVLEVAEPADRDWPKWRGYFEKKCGKRIDELAWQLCLDSTGRVLSLVASEITKAATFVGEKPVITLDDMKALRVGGGVEGIFEFVEDVLTRRKAEAMRRLDGLQRAQEPEIKILSLLVRAFRQVEAYRVCEKERILDPKLMAQRVGIPPFFLPKIKAQSERHSDASLMRAFQLLAESDFAMKRGQGGLFDTFLVPYFQESGVLVQTASARSRSGAN